MDENFLQLLDSQLGKILGWEELCPGVYSLNVQPDPDGAYSWSEYYLVLDGAPISREARALGKSLDGIPGLLYPIDPPDEGSWTAVMYELCKARLTHGVPPLEGWSLSDAAMEGMELCPAYFGPFPVPPCTPWGWTLRHKPLDNGIYWMETSQGKTVLAVCNPVWSTELSDGVTRTGKKLAYDSGNGDTEPLDYLFFDQETSCTAIFELLKVRPEWITAGLIRKAELMNAVWEYAPLYASSYNAGEQAGLHDGLGLLLQALGGDWELEEGSPEEMIALSEAGTDYIGFWN